MDDRPETLMTVAETAERLGVTPRALRLYERKGLVTPRRTAAGWRVYGRAELERLHVVIALKAMGVPLARIGEQLRSGAADLAAVLAAQETALLADKVRTARALKLVRAARARLADTSSLTSDELIELTKETAMAEWKSTPEVEALFHKHYTPEQLAAFAQRPWSEADQAALSERWGALVARAEAMVGGDPGSPEALALAREWRAEVEKFTLGDASVAAGLEAIYEEGMSRPDTVAAMPFSKDVYAFMKAARAKLAESEDDGPVV